MKQKIFTESYFASASETNPEQELAVTELVVKIIDIATAHANSLGIGNPSMVDIGGGWVLSRLTVEMKRYPRVNEDYSLSTWVEDWNNRFSVRAFRVTAESGEVLGYARSVWMVLNTETHNGMSLASLPFNREMIATDLQCPISRQARHLQILPPDSKPNATTLTATAPPREYIFKYCDLDSYRHVNTVRYVTLLLNQFSLEDFDNSFISRIEMSFLHEAKYGMKIDILRHDTDEDSEVLSTSLLLRDREEATPLLYARIFRKKRN